MQVKQIQTFSLQKKNHIKRACQVSRRLALCVCLLKTKLKKSLSLRSCFPTLLETKWVSTLLTYLPLPQDKIKEENKDQNPTPLHSFPPPAEMEGCVNTKQEKAREPQKTKASHSIYDRELFLGGRRRRDFVNT